MLDRKSIRRAVEMQNRSYLLLKWMGKAVDEGFIRVETAHDYASLPEAAEAWILRHTMNIPPEARVPPEDLREFCALFCTYLENSFVLVPPPARQLHSADAHCFCPMCSWLINAPHLKAKKFSSSDKRRARKMKIATILGIAAGHAVRLTDEEVDALVDDPRLRDVVSLVTYGHDLLRRMKGIAEGPAVLVLWRGFAWTEAGAPRKGFRLTADAIFDSEQKLSDIVLARSQQ